MQDPTNTLSKLKAKLKRQSFIVSQTLDEIKAYEEYLTHCSSIAGMRSAFEVPEPADQALRKIEVYNPGSGYNNDVNQLRIPGA